MAYESWGDKIRRIEQEREDEFWEWTCPSPKPKDPTIESLLREVFDLRKRVTALENKLL